MGQSQADIYHVHLWFDRLFADPRLFAPDQQSFARRYLLSQGLTEINARLIYQRRDPEPLDDAGKPSRIAGSASYKLDGGGRVRAEYMKGANLRIEYADLGTGLTVNDHRGLWERRCLWDMPFDLKKFDHKTADLDIPDMERLYSEIKSKAEPTTIATVELSTLPPELFDIGVAVLEARLSLFAERDRVHVEVYSARDLTEDEKMSLERRLTVQASPTTVYVILGKETVDRLVR